MIYDLAFIGVTLVSIVIGALIGFRKAYLSLIQYIVIVVLLFTVVAPLAKKLDDAGAGNVFYGKYVEQFNKSEKLKNAICVEDNKIKIPELSQPISVKEALEKLKIPTVGYEKLFEQKMKEGLTVSQVFAESATDYTLKAIVSISIIIVVTIVFAVLKALLRRKSKGEKKSKSDRIFGAVTGLLIGILIGLIFVIILKLLSAFEKPTANKMIEMMDKSYLVKGIYDSDFINKIMHR